jgi:riboflavin kinase / FMN adenylyltransferase
MKIYLNLNDFPVYKKPAAVAIGNFDGVHVGHQHIFKIVSEISQKRHYPPVAVTFFPHPGKMTHPEKIFLIQTLNQRLDDIAALGIDDILVIPFDRNFANITALEFVRDILYEKIQSAHIVVGNNFRFGKNRSGNVAMLKELASPYNICVHLVSPVQLNREPVSSSSIRKCLFSSQIDKANQYLGKPYTIHGRVIKGQSRGRALGFPTANLLTENEILPPGVFISKSRFDGRTCTSLTNIGIRPTFEDEKKNKNDLHVETYLIGMEAPLYGKHMRLSLLKKIRDEKTFRSPLDLQVQIRKDLDYALAYLESSRPI